MKLTVVFLLLIGVMSRALTSETLPNNKKSWRVILNNDGGDSLGPEESSKSSSEDPDPIKAFLNRRTTGIENTGITTVSYCGGLTLGMTTGRSKIAEQFIPESMTDQQGKKFPLSLVQILKDKGTDPVEQVVNYCRAHHLEVFWSMRMNDGHDAKNPDLLPAFKKAHPDWMLGSSDKPSPFGIWSCMDYSEQGVRDFALSLIREAAENYDIDGVEMDFFRHPVFFKSVAKGGIASDADRADITDLVRQARLSLDKIGKSKGKDGRKILLGARVPDSIEYCRNIGLDIEEWLKSGLLDFVIFGGYFRLTDWSESAALAKKYGVPSYASLDHPVARIPSVPIKNELPLEKQYGWISDGKIDARRRDIESYRARITSAIGQGHQGVYFFNDWDIHGPLFRELQDFEKFSSGPKKIFYMYRGTQQTPSKYLKAGNTYFKRPIVNPGYPALIGAHPLELPIFIPLKDTPSQNEMIDVVLDFTGSTLPLSPVMIELNGHQLKDAQAEEAVLKFEYPASLLQKNGINKIVITGSKANQLLLRDLMIQTSF